MNADTLYIIGNGFDIYHGLHTSYSDFRKWLKYHYPCIYNEMRTAFKTDKSWWCDFEQNLGELDLNKYYNKYHKDVPVSLIRKVRREHPDFLPPYVSSSSAAERLRGLFDLLSYSLAKWIASVETTYLAKQKLKIDKHALYLSFNYTSFFETVYKINRKDILYIHGNNHRRDNLIFGHNRDYINDDLGVIDEDTNKIKLVLSSKSKNPYQYYYKNELFFNELSDVTNVIVLGCSFSEVDIEYFSFINSRIKQGAQWEISWYSDEDKTRISNALQHMVTNYTFIRMDDLSVKG